MASMGLANSQRPIAKDRPPIAERRQLSADRRFGPSRQRRYNAVTTTTRYSKEPYGLTQAASLVRSRRDRGAGRRHAVGLAGVARRAGAAGGATGGCHAAPHAHPGAHGHA